MSAGLGLFPERPAMIVRARVSAVDSIGAEANVRISFILCPTASLRERSVLLRILPSRIELRNTEETALWPTIDVCNVSSPLLGRRTSPIPVRYGASRTSLAACVVPCDNRSHPLVPG